MLNIIILLYFMIVAVYLFLWMKGRWMLNPSVLWVSTQAVFFVGTVMSINLNIPSDIVLIYVMFIGLITFIFGTLLVDITNIHSRARISNWLSNQLIVEDNKYFLAIIWGFLIVSALVSVLYFRAIGYNLFLTSLSSFFSGNGTVDDVTTLRLAAYTGSRYLAPGYVNQFKNVLLPVTSMYLLVAGYYSTNYSKLYRFALLLLLPFNIAAILGTGQRAAFFFVCLIVGYFYNTTLPRRLSYKLNLVLGGSALLLFVMQTLFLGRATVESTVSAAGVLASAQQFGVRVLFVNQISGIEGFRYIYDAPIQYGNEWLEGIVALLPGQRQHISISKILWSVRKGGFRGTSPPSLWGSIWYDFGILGIFTIPFLMGCIYQYIYSRILRGRRTIFRIAIYSVVVVLLGTWLTNGPDSLVNRGFLTVIIFCIVVRMFIHVMNKIFSVDSYKKTNGTTHRVQIRFNIA